MPGAGRAALHDAVALGTPLLRLLGDPGEGSEEQRCASPHLFQSKPQCLIAFPAGLHSGQLHVLYLHAVEIEYPSGVLD